MPITGSVKGDSLPPQIKKVTITEEMVNRALAKGADLGKLKDSIRKGEGNAAGFLGEEVVKAYFGVGSRNTYDYDLLFKGKRLEAKTKSTTVVPRLNYECSVAAANTFQKCDYYVFVRVTEDLRQGWIVGIITKTEFYKVARFSPKGSHETDNDYTEKADCWKARVEQLYDIDQFKLHYDLQEATKEQTGAEPQVGISSQERAA